MARKTISGDEYNHFLSQGEPNRSAILAGWGMEGEPKVSIDGDAVTLDDGRKKPKAEPAPGTQPQTAAPDPQAQWDPYASQPQPGGDSA